MDSKQWHRNLISYLHSLDFENCEELFTAFLYCLFSSKHLILRCSHQDIHQLSFVLEHMSHLTFGFSSSILTLTPGMSESDFKKHFLVRAKFKEKESMTFNEEENFRPMKRDRSFSLAQTPSDHPFYQQHFKSNSKVEEEGEEVEGIKRGHQSFSAHPMKKIPNIMILECLNRFPDSIVDTLSNILFDKQVIESEISYPLPNHFMIILIQSSSKPFPSVLNDFFFYQLDIFTQIPNISGQILRKSPVSSTRELEEIFNKLDQVFISSDTSRYIRDVVLSIRRHPQLYMGISPKASADLLFACKITANLLYGLNYVLPEHLEFIIPKILLHRLKLKPGKKEKIGKEIELLTYLQQALQYVLKPF